MVLKSLDVFEVVSLLESGELEGESYVYDVRIREWYLVKNIAVLKDTNFKFRVAEVVEAPTFTPPFNMPDDKPCYDKDSDYLYLLQHMKTRESSVADTEVPEVLSANSLNSELKELVEKLSKDKTYLNSMKSIQEKSESEISSLKLELIQEKNRSKEFEMECFKLSQENKSTYIETQETSEGNYSELLFKYEELENKYLTEVENKEPSASDNCSQEYLKTELINSQEEVLALKETIQGMSLESQVITHSEKNDKNISLISNLRSDNKQLIEKYNSLRSSTAKYKIAYNDLCESYKELKIKYSNSKTKLVKLQKDSKETIGSLNDKIDTANIIHSRRMNELEELKNREESLIVRIEELETAAIQDVDVDLNIDDNDDELARLIGDAFEVSNDRIWKVSRDGQEPSGPYDFSEIYSMKINGELDTNVKIKKGNELYKAKSEIFELSVPVSTHGVGEKTRYFIKRTSMRVPYYELVTFEVNGEEIRGYCTSLSLGGIFIELPKLSEDLSLDKKGRILFSAGALDNPFQCIAQIKNISESRPRGIGLMFVDLPEQAKIDMEFYINNYIDKTQKVA